MQKYWFPLFDFEMAPNDRELRVTKRSITTSIRELETLSNEPVDDEIYFQIETALNDSVKSDWEKYQKLVQTFSMEVDETKKEDIDLELVIIEEHNKIKNDYYKLCAKIKKLAIELKIESKRRQASLVEDGEKRKPEATTQPKLKDIEVPKFDGDRSKFLDWKAMYETLVHENPAYGNAERMFYLKKALVSEAELVLRDCNLVPEAYPETWSYVLERYENKRAIVRDLFVKLFDLQPIQSENGIRELVDKTTALLRGLKAAGEQIDDTFSRSIAFMVTSKLDKETAKDWNNYSSSSDRYPLHTDLFKFLQNRTFVIEERKIVKITEKKRDVKDGVTKPVKKTFATSSSKIECPMCGNTHYLNKCEQFKKLSPRRRFAFAAKLHLCFICFSPEHGSDDCKFMYRCRCGKPHHSLLHFEFKERDPSSTEEKSTEEKITKSCSTVLSASNTVILLPSAVVRFNCNSVYGNMRVLLDSCSQPTVISDRVVARYGLTKEKMNRGSIIEGATPGMVSTDELVRLCLVSRTKQFSIEVEAEVVPKSSMSYRISTSIDKKDLSELSKLQLADPALKKSIVRIEDVDMIIGAEYYERCICNQTLKVSNLNLRLSNFGWTVSGPLVPAQPERKKFTGFTMKTLEKSMKLFHQQQAVEISEPGVVEKNECESCLRHFEATHRVGCDGKFVLRLPFKVDKSRVANNRVLALRSLFKLEKTLPPDQKTKYVDFMREYISMGHASLVKPTNEPCYYIPHRAVVREESSTTPLRVVFNASSKLKGEMSLNDALMLGPQIQRELFDIVISARSYRYVFTADVAKMYRMVWIDEKDRDMQRILWRESPNEPIKEYCLNTVTYGTVPASFMATQCLEVIARQIEKNYPRVAAMIRSSFYMDDMIYGSDNLDELCEDRQLLHEVLSSYGFKLRKYCANAQEIVSEIPNELLANGSNIELASGSAMLGILWTPNSDEFSIKVASEVEEVQSRWTKRLMLSYLSRTFDPLGILAPVFLRGKLLMQSLWSQGVRWDARAPMQIADVFREYLLDLDVLKSLSVKRYVCSPVGKRQLIGFCDASSSACCAVIYVRVIEGDNTVHSTQFLCAKTMIAPKKNNSIPRLELASAALLAKLMNRVRCVLEIELSECFLFSDATVVLFWLSKPAEEWKTFVSNRVSLVQNLFPYPQWFYINTKKNPADLATRGLTADEFLSSKEWFEGPKFLQKVEISSDPVPNLDVAEALEKRKVKTFKITSTSNPCSLFERFSSLTKLLHVFAYVLRFINNSRNARKKDKHVLPVNFDNGKNVPLSVSELDQSRNFVLRLVQNSFFSDDIERLKNNRALKARSKLLPMTPFLDDSGILRVGGRLKNSSLSVQRKHPIILPSNAHFTKLFLNWIHVKYFHANRRFMLGYLSARFWIFGGALNAVKAVVRNCIRCVRFRGEVSSQLMGQLPAYRVNISRPFSHTGVDLCGPFQTKCVAHRVTRFYNVYVAIFVCMAVKCIHLELVTDLSANKFIEAFQRFMARRGAPSFMYSDNGGNFIGTKNMLIANHEKIESFTTSEGIEWSPIPARSAHFGGLWEAGVGSIKYHLNRVNGQNVMSYDEYDTLITRIEGVLNSRPLCMKDSQSQEVLTPAHFLIGDSLTSPPELEVEPDNVKLRGRWIEVNKRVQSFWNLWKRDYLSQLQKKQKWMKDQPNLEVGRMVLLKDDDSHPCEWPMGIVMKVYPDSEGKVRVADIRTAHSQAGLKRAISKLVLLPIDVDCER